MHVTAEIKNYFFDRSKVIERIGKANARRLSRMGAFVRQRAQRAILRRGTGRIRRPARPGQPPRVWSRDSYANLKNIRFGASSDGQAVVIGPLFVPRMKPVGSSSPTVPHLLTHGGTTTRWGRGQDRGRRVAVRLHPHPFMGPALDAEIAAGTINDVWSTEVS